MTLHTHITGYIRERRVEPLLIWMEIGVSVYGEGKRKPFCECIPNRMFHRVLETTQQEFKRLIVAGVKPIVLPPPQAKRKPTKRRRNDKTKRKSKKAKRPSAARDDLEYIALLQLVASLGVDITDLV